MFERLFIDASFLLARYNRRDEYHSRACSFERTFGQARELWTTDAVLQEVAAGFAMPSSRAIAVAIWDQFHDGDPRSCLVHASSAELKLAMQLYRQRFDKAWSLTDCLSFQVMEREQLTVALTADRHFVQAGFRALLLE